MKIEGSPTLNYGKTWRNLLFPGHEIEHKEFLIGVLLGEGVGKEVIEASLELLEVVTAPSESKIRIKYGDIIGRESERVYGHSLTDRVIDFCEEVFAEKGALLNGPGGGRYVYNLRKHFDIFFKISPLQIANGVLESSCLKEEYVRGLDLLVVRENSGGVYQGIDGMNGDHVKERTTHTFGYSEHQVFRFLNAAAKLAQQRRGHLTVAWKESGVPGISELWKNCAKEVSQEHGIEFEMVDIDYLAYRLIHEGQGFDLIAAPNLFGDVLGDLGATLLGSRGVSYSGNFNDKGAAVYQTNHGCAHDIAGKNIANPAGQMFSLAMLLRESFNMIDEAERIELAIRDVWSKGYVTADLKLKEGKILGTKEWTGLVLESAENLMNH